jgi:hypothetical protein
VTGMVAKTFVLEFVIPGRIEDANHGAQLRT